MLVGMRLCDCLGLIEGVSATNDLLRQLSGCGSEFPVRDAESTVAGWPNRILAMHSGQRACDMAAAIDGVGRCEGGYCTVEVKPGSGEGADYGAPLAVVKVAARGLVLTTMAMDGSDEISHIEHSSILKRLPAVTT
jgi:hypothetical protein